MLSMKVGNLAHVSGRLLLYDFCVPFEELAR